MTRNIFFFINDFINLSCADGRFGNIAGKLDNPAERAVDHADIGGEAEQASEGQGAGQNLLPAEIKVKIFSKSDDEADDRKDQIPEAVRLIHTFGKAGRIAFIVGNLSFFASIGFDDQDAAEDVVQGGFRLAEVVPDQLVTAVDVLENPSGCGNGKWNGKENQKGEFPVHQEHDNKNHGSREDAHYGFLAVKGDKLLHLFRVVGDALDLLAGRTPGDGFHRLFLNFLEEFAAEVPPDGHGDFCSTAFVDNFHNHDEEGDEHKNAQNQEQAAEIRVARGDVVVDNHALKIGIENPEKLDDGSCQNRKEERPFI